MGEDTLTPESNLKGAPASTSQWDAADYARIGDVLASMDRNYEAAAAYSRALELTTGAKPENRWPLLLLRASSLEEGKRWPEARNDLTEALALAPEEPLILNFLGYAQLERGENLDAAEAMIRKASALAPDDASITDSLVDMAVDTVDRSSLDGLVIGDRNPGAVAVQCRDQASALQLHVDRRGNKTRRQRLLDHRDARGPEVWNSSRKGFATTLDDRVPWCNRLSNACNLQIPPE